MQKVKDKEKILKGARGKKQLTHRGAKIKMIRDFSETHISKKRVERNI